MSGGVIGTATQIVGFLAAAGVISVVLTHVLSRSKEKEARSLANSDAAIRLAVYFEDYAGKCADVIIFNNQKMTSGNSQGSRVNLPTLEDLILNDDGWRGLYAEFVAVAREFPLYIKQSQEIIQSGLDIVDDPKEDLTWDDLAQEVIDHAVILGSRAWRLAESLRKQHGYDPLKSQYAFQKVFLDRYQETIARRRSHGAQL